MTTRICLLLAIALLCLGLAACGGGGGSSTSTSTAATQAGGKARTAMGEATAKKPAAGKGSKQGRSGQRSGGSAQFRVKGGDNSVQEFGGEAGESELREVAEVVHSFYVARVAGEWARACSYLAASQVKSLEQLAAQSPQLKGRGCPAVLAAFTQPQPTSTSRQLTTVDAAALREEGEQAFLIYTGPPGKTVYAMPMKQEDGEWKVGALSGDALPGAGTP